MTYAIKLKGQTGDKAYIKNRAGRVKQFRFKFLADMEANNKEIIPEDWRDRFEVVTYKKEERHV